MPIEPNIALGVKPLEVPNPLNQFAQAAQIQHYQNQNRLADMQAAEYERARTEEEGTRNFLRGKDLSSPEVQAGLLQYGKTGREFASNLATQRKLGVETQSAEFKLAEDKLKHGLESVASAPTPQAYVAKIKEGVARGYFLPADAEARIAQVPQNPEEYKKFRIDSLLHLVDNKDKLAAVLPNVKQQEAGGQILNIQNNPMMPGYGLPVAGQSITKTQTFADKSAAGQLGVAQARLAFDQQKAEQPQFNAQAGGFIAPPTKENPQGVFIPATGIQAAKDQGAAVKALQSAGYNAETGEDTISKLISKSTSGGLQAGGAAMLAFFGKSTEGRKAIAALEGTANQIATDLAGGKLGAGISNTDRDFIVSALGDVANPYKTSEERLSGWNAAKNRMMLTGLIPLPKAAEPTAAAPSGADEWKVIK